MPRKHCNTTGKCSDGIDVHNDFETSSEWTGIYQIMKKDSDFPSSWQQQQQQQHKLYYHIKVNLIYNIIY